MSGGLYVWSTYSTRRGWRCRNKRWVCGDGVEPGRQLGVSRPPTEVGIESFHSEGAGERDLSQVEGAAHQRVVDLQLPEVGHANAALGFVLEDRGGALVPGTSELAAPYGESIQEAPCQRFETARLPRLLPFRRIEGGFAIKVIEVGADESRFL